MQWIEDHHELLKPPVRNKLVWEDSDFLVMVVVGPNFRRDFHIDVSEEIFYQIEGDIILKVIEDKKMKDITIRQGELFLLPSNIPHSPRRPNNTIGIVMERKRNQNEKDGFQWYCEQCGEMLHEEFTHIADIEKQLPEVFDRFYENPEKTTCANCGAKHEKPEV